MVPHLLSPFGDRRSKFIVATPRIGSIITKRRKTSRHHRSRGLQWSNIHFDVLERAQRKLPFGDALRCREVCSHWRSVTQNHISSSLNFPPPPPDATQPPPPPPLLWHYPCNFIDPAKPEKPFYQLNRKSKHFLHSPDVGACVGFSHGWFLYVDRTQDNVLSLFHPSLVSAAYVRFPPIVTREGFRPIIAPVKACGDLIKAVFWGDPILSKGNYGIVIIHPRYKNLIFAKSGATQFTDLAPIDTRWFSKWKDIVCFQNRIYAVGLTHDAQHYMEGWDCTVPYASPTKVFDFQPPFSSGNWPSWQESDLHLVESQGELLLVSIQLPDSKKLINIKYKTPISFPKLFVLARSSDTIRVYKMDFQQMKWVQLHSLGDRALFITEIQKFSVSIHDFPQYKRNTVYFEHQLKARALSSTCIGVFNMEDGSMTEIWPSKVS